MHTGHVKYEDDETLKDEMEKTVEGWKASRAHGLEECILLRCACYPKQAQLHRGPLQNTNGILHRTRENPKISWETKGQSHSSHSSMVLG